jgi:pyrimidine-nucleoside phosphorylase
MNQPLGRAVGNALELVEAIDTLRGAGPDDLLEHSLVICQQMVLMSGRASDDAEARGMLEASLKKGLAWSKFREWIAAQGGELESVDDPARLPRASLVDTLVSPRSACVASIDARNVGLTAAMLGGGRRKKGEAIDHAVGVVLQVKVGDEVAQGDPLCTIHANSTERLTEACRRLTRAFEFSDDPVPPLPLVHQIIS